MLGIAVGQGVVVGFCVGVAGGVGVGVGVDVAVGVAVGRASKVAVAALAVWVASCSWLGPQPRRKIPITNRQGRTNGFFITVPSSLNQ